jgi:Zn-dependent peptidase ImmA (M78 family)
VKINAALTAAPERRNRARTTIAHEWFHAVYHSPVWELHWARAAITGRQIESHACSHDDVASAREDNWLEFQARYASCALLIPKSCAHRVVEQFLETDPPGISAVIDHVARTFEVSRDAAEWRLTQLKLAPKLKFLRQTTLWDQLK